MPTSHSAVPWPAESDLIVRPQFHFTALTGWINDPHGITYRNGAYDVFYQFVPDSMVWAVGCQWGHATGPDLLSLTPGPVALAPGDGDDGVWTGVIVQHDGTDRIFYTSVSNPAIGVGRVRVATSRGDEWVDWRKGSVVVEAPEGLDVDAFRDPFVIREPDGSWRMFVGAALTTGSAAALSYHSVDLDTWQYEGVALQRSNAEQYPVWTGALWECPQIVPLGEQHVMISSVWDADVLHYAAYALGAYSDGHFDAATWGRLTYGPSYYAPSYFRDGAGRPCVTFWMREVGDPVAGWAGTHSIPYTLSLVRGRPALTPHPDVEAYRTRPSLPSVVEGLAADLLWVPGSSLEINSGGVQLAAISIDGPLLTLLVGDASWQMPYVDGAVRVILDGPTLEISSRCGLIGSAIQPQGESLQFRSDTAIEVWGLER